MSGKVALAMGAKMKALSKNYQVLCITHLASVAVIMPIRIIWSIKRQSASETITSVQELDQDKNDSRISCNDKWGSESKSERIDARSMGEDSWLESYYILI